MHITGTEKEYLLPKQQKTHGHMQGYEWSEDYEECITIFFLYYLNNIPSALPASTFCLTEPVFSCM